MLHFRNTNLKPIGVAIAAIFSIIVYKDYQLWREQMLPGGLPGNLFGYFLSCLTTVLLRRDKRNVKSIDYSTVAKCGITEGFLKAEDIPNHQGLTPETAKWVIPHRQVSPPKVEKLWFLSNEMLKEVQEQHLDGQLTISQSLIESHLNALFAGEISSANEVAHIHPKDGSIHMYLCPYDAKTVVEKGWGELHPLRAGYQPSKMESVLIFAPQSQDEIKIHQKFLKAAINANCARKFSESFKTSNTTNKENII